jgi:hypothetical protein
MAATLLTDIYIPEVWNPYILERTAELSTLRTSGIVAPDPRLDILARTGGKLINMPFFNDLTGNSEVLDDGDDLTVNSITASKDIAALLCRGKSFGAKDLVSALAGSDPMAAISNLIAEWWNRDEQTTLINILTGVFADNEDNDSSDLINDISSEDFVGDGSLDSNLISADAIIDTTFKLGDNFNKLTAIMIHSVPYAKLQKLNLIDFEPTNTQNIGFGTYLGKTIIVNDNCPTAAGNTSGTKYTTYFFGNGAIGMGEGSPEVPSELERNALIGGGETYLVHRRHFIMHPRGIKFTSNTVSKDTPTNANLALSANWDRVYEKKNIRLAKLVTNG